MNHHAFEVIVNTFTLGLLILIIGLVVGFLSMPVEFISKTLSRWTEFVGMALMGLGSIAALAGISAGAVTLVVDLIGF